MACRIKKTAEGISDRLLSYTQELISAESLSGGESAAARSLSRMLREAGFDCVNADEVGNVIGVINGGTRGPGLILNGHLDTVPGADMECPFEPRVVDGGRAVIGRGACDMKGPLASMVGAGSILRMIGVRPPHDLVVTASVLEEVGGSVGSRHLVRNGLTGRLAVVGEPTDLRVHLGHRGSVHIDIGTIGKAAHASMPESGLNAIYLMGPIITAIESLGDRLPVHPSLGRASVAACNISAEPGARNVVPSACTLSANFRTTPGMTEDGVLSLLEESLTPIAGRIGDRWTAAIARNSGTTYTGFQFDTPKVMRGYWRDPVGAEFEAVKTAVEIATGRPVELSSWRFSTDAPCFGVDAGIPTYGFGPGDDALAHSATEYVAAEDLSKAAAAYALLSLMA